jgi:hypothetical protein
MRELRSDLGRILVMAEQDPRLSWPERQLIRQLGVKLYGKRPEHSR